MAVSHIKNVTIADFTGTVTVFNSLGLTQTANATDLIRPLDWNSVHNQYMTLSGNTANSSNISGSNIVFQGGNNITLSGVSAAGAATVVISGPNTVAQSQQPMAFSGANGSGTANTITFANSNGVSFSTGTQGVYATVKTDYLTTAALSQDSSKYAGIGTTFAGANVSGSMTLNTAGLNLSLSAAAPGGGGNTMTVSAANGTFQSNAITFANSNGVTFSTGTQGVYASVKTDYLTTAMLSNAATISNINMSAGTTSTNASAFTFANSNGVTFGLGTGASAGSITATVATNYQSQGAYLTTADLSQNSSKYAGINSAITNGLMTLNTSGLSLNLSALLSTARASNDAIGLNTALTANGLSVTANSSGLSINMPAFDLAANTTKYAGISTGFTGANVSGSMTLNTAGLAMSLSVAAPGGGAAVNVSAGTASANLQSIVFANSNGVSFGLGTGASSQSITASAAGGGGGVALGISNTTFTSGTVVFNASGALTIGSGAQSANFSVPQTSQLSALTGITIGTTGSTIGFSVGPAPVYAHIPYFPASTGVQTKGVMGVTSGSVICFPVSIVANQINFNRINLAEFWSYVSSSIAGSQTVGSRFGLYSNNNNTLSLISSNSYSIAISNSSVSATFSYPTNSNSTGYGYGTTTGSTTAQIQSMFGTVGFKAAGLVMGSSNSLAQGVYWMGILQTGSSVGFNGGISAGMAGNVMAVGQNIGDIGVASATSGNFEFGWGALTITSTGLPTTIAVTNINNSMTVMPMLTFIST